jgi:MOSC domain-containing protein YiiM
VGQKDFESGHNGIQGPVPSPPSLPSPPSPSLHAIWLKPNRRGAMEPLSAAELVAGRGLAGNVYHGERRQVTIIEREAWDAMMDELDATLPPQTRRANLMVSGVRLRGSRGQILEIGDCRLEVLGETRPCDRMDEALPGLKTAMSPGWRGGVFAKVLVGGPIRVGDPVRLRSANMELWADAESAR